MVLRMLLTYLMRAPSFLSVSISLNFSFQYILINEKRCGDYRSMWNLIAVCIM